MLGLSLIYVSKRGPWWPFIGLLPYRVLQNKHRIITPLAWTAQHLVSLHLKIRTTPSGKCAKLLNTCRKIHSWFLDHIISEDRYFQGNTLKEDAIGTLDGGVLCKGDKLLGLYATPHMRIHDDVFKWKHFPRSWPFARHRSPVDSPHKGQRRGALMFSLICAGTNGWANNRYASDLRRRRAHCDDIVMQSRDK